MKIKPIKTDRDHSAALNEIERLWGSKEGTPGGDHLEILATLVEAYERQHHPIETPDPLDAIRFRLEQQGADYGRLIGIIGHRTRVYEVMRGDRPLSLEMIRRLHNLLNIPAEVLIQPRKRLPSRRPKRSEKLSIRQKR